MNYSQLTLCPLPITVIVLNSVSPFHPGSHVQLDPVLASCLTNKSEGLVESLRWDELHQRCLQRMSPGHVVLFKGEPPVVKKGAVPSVELTTATRSGNKKVSTHASVRQIDTIGKVGIMACSG